MIILIYHDSAKYIIYMFKILIKYLCYISLTHMSDNIWQHGLNIEEAMKVWGTSWKTIRHDSIWGFMGLWSNMGHMNSKRQCRRHIKIAWASGATWDIWIRKDSVVDTSKNEISPTINWEGLVFFPTNRSMLNHSAISQSWHFF